MSHAHDWHPDGQNDKGHYMRCSICGVVTFIKKPADDGRNLPEGSE